MSSMLERLHRPLDAVVRDLIDSFDQDSELYVAGSVGLLPGTRTMTWQNACSSQCPHVGVQCHRSHVAWLNHDALGSLVDVLADDPRQVS